MGEERLDVDVSDVRGLDRAFLGEYVTEGVVQILEFGRRWFDACAAPADPYSASEAQRLETALAGDLDPVDRSVRAVVPADPAGDRRAAAGLEKRRHPLVHTLGILLYADDVGSVGDS